MDTFEIIILTSTVLFHALSAVALILMVRTIMNAEKNRISHINNGGAHDNGGGESPSQTTE